MVPTQRNSRSFEPTATRFNAVADVFTQQPGEALPTQSTVGPTIHLKLSEPAPLTDAQKYTIYQNLTTYQQQGYPLAQWNALNPSDQTLLEQAGIRPQPAPGAPSSPQSSSLSTGAVVAIVGVVGVVGWGAWYFWFRK